MGLMVDISLGLLLLFGAFFLEIIAVHVLDFYILNEKRDMFTIVLTAFLAKPGTGVVFLLGGVRGLRYFIYPGVFGWIFGVSKAIYKINGDQEVTEKEARWPILLIIGIDLLAVQLLFYIF